jgi:flagellar protein FliL
MSDNAEANAEAPAKRSKMPLLLGLVLALVLGGGGFYAVFSGLILAPDTAHGGDDAHDMAAMPDVAFVPIDSVIVALGTGADSRHLKFTAQVEVEAAHAADVTLLVPRIMDVFNSYLNAIDPLGLDDSAAIVRVRSQLLRRVQVVVGEGRVRDLLITEFVLN